MPQFDQTLSMNDVDHRTDIFFETCKVLCVESVHVGILHVVVDPYAMNEVKRIGVVLVELVERLVEVRSQEDVHADGIGAHVLDLLEPPQIRLLVDGVVGGEVAGDARA